MCTCSDALRYEHALKLLRDQEANFREEALTFAKANPGKINQNIPAAKAAALCGIQQELMQAEMAEPTMPVWMDCVNIFKVFARRVKTA